MRTLTGLPQAGSIAEIARLRHFVARHVFLDVLDLRDERLPELVHQRHPASSPRETGIERVLQRGGESVLRRSGGNASSGND